MSDVLTMLCWLETDSHFLSLSTLPCTQPAAGNRSISYLQHCHLLPAQAWPKQWQLWAEIKYHNPQIQKDAILCFTEPSSPQIVPTEVRTNTPQSGGAVVLWLTVMLRAG